ncbi:MAG: hypothetical protein HQ453_10760 [Actinobacteria bacterium]|nr:hypothetical protein [Actinomycetota bacterium]
MGRLGARVLQGLGREDGLDTDGLRRVVSPVSRFQGMRIPTRQAAGAG